MRGRRLLIGAVGLVWSIVALQLLRRRPVEVVATAAPTGGLAGELVVPTLPLELGEGDDRSSLIDVWPANGASLVAVTAGTRVAKLEDRDYHVIPSQAPRCERNIRCLSRIHVTSGPHAGVVAYVRNYQVQAAR